MCIDSAFCNRRLRYHAVGPELGRIAKIQTETLPTSPIGTASGVRAYARAYKRVQHPFPPRTLEIYLELVAFDLGDDSIAEFGVEHALAEG
jgi:hypothetical protein